MRAPSDRREADVAGRDIGDSRGRPESCKVYARAASTCRTCRRGAHIAHWLTGLGAAVSLREDTSGVELFEGRAAVEGRIAVLPKGFVRRETGSSCSPVQNTHHLHDVIILLVYQEMTHQHRSDRAHGHRGGLVDESTKRGFFRGEYLFSEPPLFISWLLVCPDSNKVLLRVLFGLFRLALHGTNGTIDG